MLKTVIPKPFPKINLKEKTEQYYIVERFLTKPYWEDEQKDLFAENVVVDYPYAPPGMHQHMSPYEFSLHCIWLKNIISDWKVVGEPVIIPTTDPNLFWAIRSESSNMYLALKNGEYYNECVYRIVLKDNLIQEFREYANPTEYYNVMGYVLPMWYYESDTVEVGTAPLCRMPKDAISEFTTEQNRNRALQTFANPITFDDGSDESVYANDVYEATPYSPYDQKTNWSGEKFDVHVEWMIRRTLEWNTPDSFPFYLSTDPNVIIVESYGYGHMGWGGQEGHYTQRELQIAHLDENGKIDHFRVYFNPMYKFFSINQSLPTIPYFNY